MDRDVAVRSPALPTARQTAPAEQRLAEALGRYCRADGNRWGVDLEARTLREVERPFSRLRWCRVAGPGVSHDIVVKAARGSSPAAHGAAIAEAEAARRLEAVFAGDPALSVVAPERVYADLSVVITMAIAARSLAVSIEERAGWWPSAAVLRDLEQGCTLAGRWLRHLHDACPAPPTWTTDTLREDLMLRVRLLREFPRTYGLSAGLADRLERWIDVHVQRGSAQDLACSETHRDYSPSNMLYDGQVLRVIDFGTLRPAPRLLDATRFLHQIQMLSAKPRYRRATRRALEAAFATGYGPADLLGSPLVPVFLARHELAHWLGAARRVTRRANLSGSMYTCWLHRSTLRAVEHLA